MTKAKKVVSLLLSLLMILALSLRAHDYAIFVYHISFFFTVCKRLFVRRTIVWHIATITIFWKHSVNHLTHLLTKFLQVHQLSFS